MGEWMYRSTYSRPRQYLEVSVQLHSQVASPVEKETPVPIGQGLRAGLGDVERTKILHLPGLKLRHLGRPSRIQSLTSNMCNVL
jgi:hypothetical protein